MAINFTVVRWINDGEPLAAEVLNRPTQDLAVELEANLVSTIQSLSADEAVVYAIALG